MNNSSARLAAVGLACLCLGVVIGWQAADVRDSAIVAPSPVTDPSGASAPATAATTSTPLPSNTTTETTIEYPRSLFVDATAASSGDGRAPERPVQTVDRALELAAPGDTIFLAPGRYPAIKVRNVSGLTLTPWPDRQGVVLVSDDDYSRTAAVLIEDSSDIVVRDLALQTSLWGVMIRASESVLIEGLSVSDIGQEAIHVKSNSYDVIIRGNTVRSTGRRAGGPGEFGFEKFGEGIYIGTGGEIDNPDTTSRILIEANDISFTTAEAIDIKPFVQDVQIRRNLIHDISTNTSGAVVVGVGNDLYADPRVVIAENLIWNITTQTTFTDGNAIRLSAAATISANVIFNTQHHAVLADEGFVNPDSRLVVISNNLAFETSDPAFESWAGTNAADVLLDANIFEPTGIDDPLGPDGLPSPALIALRDELASLASDLTQLGSS